MNCLRTEPLCKPLKSTQVLPQMRRMQVHRRRGSTACEQWSSHHKWALESTRLSPEGEAPDPAYDLLPLVEVTVLQDLVVDDHGVLRATGEYMAHELVHDQAHLDKVCCASSPC